MSATITAAEFQALAAQGYNRIPLVATTYADLDTSLALYLKLAHQPYTFLLESVQGGERFGRYSFIGLHADVRIQVRNHRLEVIAHGKVVESDDTCNPLDFIQDFLSRYRTPSLPGLPRFAGGLTGYFGYDTIRYIEKRFTHLRQQEESLVPDIVLMLTEALVVIDNVSSRLSFIVYADPAQPQAYEQARQRLQTLMQQLQHPAQMPAVTTTTSAEPQYEFAENDFKKAVEQAKRYIYEGDIMQVVLSQRMSVPFAVPPILLYRALRSLNPSPYMFYYHLGDYHIIGSSPEILVRLQEDTVTLRPIAGTRPRGKTPQQDAELAQELLADPKECSEHVQLMDLGRNDLGRVAEVGTVKVTDHMLIERYSHVMHIVSNVEGRLKSGMSAMDVLKATFPAGTVSGAPKIRAMEIIDELEPVRRAWYAGAVGYLGFNGDMDLAIAIRTALVQSGILQVQAGAGIVADSVPENEWIETCNKARAVLRAAEMALEAN